MEPYFAGPGWKWPFSTNLEVIHCTKHAILSQHFVRVAKLPSSPNSKKLGSSLLHKQVLQRSCGLAATLSNGTLGSRTQNTSAYPCPKRVFCWPAGNVRGQCERPRPTTHFFEDTPNVKHNACEMVRNGGENEESHIERPQNHLCFRSKRLFHLGAKMWPRISVNPSNIKAHGAQIIYPQIEFPSCTF